MRRSRLQGDVINKADRMHSTQLPPPNSGLDPRCLALVRWTGGEDDADATLTSGQRPGSRPDHEGATLTPVRPVEALYENGMLRPAKPLNLRPGERVGVIVVRQPDSARWDLARLAAVQSDDGDLASAGLDDWAAALDREDRG
jgi:predicted DNA-binding antitoxin AbrB/MazE fold protein